jgi:hypothetical protein
MSAQPSTLAKALSNLIEDSDVSKFFRECDVSAPDTTGPRTTLLFPRFKEDEPDIYRLCELLWMQVISYVIPVHRRQDAAKTISGSKTGANFAPAARLLAEAKSTFISYSEANPHRASEVGELIAYMVASYYVQATQIVPKMSLKTNANMPVHGLDGIHAKLNGTLMTLYFLESKLSKSAKNGASEYAKSTGSFYKNRKQYLLEFNLMANLGNLEALTDEHRESALKFFDVYGSGGPSRLERFIGVICYNEAEYSKKLPKDDSTSPEAHEDAFEIRYKPLIADHQKAVQTYLTKNDVDCSDCQLFFIAFPNVDALRDVFYEVMKSA